MRTLLFAALGVFIGLQAKAETCNWGYNNRPPTFSCEGQTFIYATVTCTSGVYSKVFCRKSEATSGKKCSEDNDAVTLRCGESLLGRKPAGSVPDQAPALDDQDTQPTLDQDEPTLDTEGGTPQAKKSLAAKSKPPCSPGFVPGRYHVCGSKTYFYDSAACGTDGKHHQVFCEEKFAKDVDACIGDNSEETIRCQNELIGTKPTQNSAPPERGLRSKTGVRGAQ